MQYSRFTTMACVLTSALLISSMAASAQSTTDDAGQTPQPAENNGPDLTTRAIEINGTVMMRANDEADWQSIEKDQVLPVGTQIRTGVRAAVVLRVGPNATVQVDRLSELTIGQLEHDPQTNTIRTLLGVKHGKVDFNVQHVGFENDFRIASPSDVMAVRGTLGTYKAYDGPAEVSGNQGNRPGAIQGQGRNTGQSFALSGNESVEGGDRDPDQTQQTQQNVGDKMPGTGGGSFDVNQHVGGDGSSALRGQESYMNTQSQFKMIAVDFPELIRVCDPTSEYYDPYKCQRVLKLLGSRYGNYHNIHNDDE